MLTHRISGYRIMGSWLVTINLKQVKFPKSKKKRIIRKWWKNKKNYKKFEQCIVDDIRKIIYVSNETYETIKNDTLYFTL